VPDHVLFDLQLLPRWEVISEIRRLIVHSLERLDVGLDAAYCASLAAHELLENAVKYGKGPVRVRIVLDRAERSVHHVEVENQATKAQALKLRRAVDEVATSGDVMRTYVAMMGRGPGGLGLARIAAEGDMALQCRVRSNRVAVLAFPQEAAHG
jgi:two-component sensor histidine kinase